MSDGASPPAPVASVPAEANQTPSEILKAEAPGQSVTNGTSNGDAAVSSNKAAKEAATDDGIAPVNNTNKEPAPEDATEDVVEAATTQEDFEMKDAENATDDAPTAPADGSDEPADGTPASGKLSKARRKSVGVPEHKKQKLNKKGSIAKITHLDAQPGDYFLARLKGYPPWPCIICSQDMLPVSLLKSRPLTAARPDGTYLPAYEDGGAKAKDRTFPIMYLATNEFGWHPNTELSEIDLDTIADQPAPKKKDLKEAHKIAAERHDLEHFKQMLIAHEESRQAEIAKKEAAKEAKKAAKNKKKNKIVLEEHDNEDIEMPDATAEEPDVPESATKKKSKKRKADEEPQTPGAPESNKKTKVSLKFTPKANGIGSSTPKSTKDNDSSTKVTKPKQSKKSKAKETVQAAPKEPELTLEEKRTKKEKEILFLRHKLQKGLVPKEQEPKEEEMKAMSEFLTKLECYSDLEVSIIRITKINKLLKAILKLNSIPKEEEFQFKPRSRALLEKWNKLLANEEATPAATNGVDADAKKSEDANIASAKTTNGVKDEKSNEKPEEPSDDKTEENTEVQTEGKADEEEAPAGRKSEVPSKAEEELLTEEDANATTESGAVESSP